MLVVTVTLSIAPGQMPPMTKLASATLRASPAASHCLWMQAAELGEVNTLLCLLAGAPVEQLLGEAGHWLSHLRSSEAGARLRHAVTSVFDTSATVETLRAAGQGSAMLLQVLGVPPSSRATSVCLSHVSGMAGRHTVFTPVSTHDEALALSRAAVEEDKVAVFDSSLWLPVKESSSS